MLQLLWLQFFFQLRRDGHNEAPNASLKGMLVLLFFVFVFSNCWLSDTDQYDK